MSIAVTCDQCRFSLKVRDELAGKRGKCPQCGGVIQVPAAAGDELLVASPTVSSLPPAFPQPTSPKPTAPQPTAPPATPAAVHDARTLAEQVMGGFRGPMPPNRFSPTYLLGALLSAVFMVALPLLYLALIGLIGWAVYLHLIYDAAIMTSVRGGRAQLAALALYLAPVVIGGMMILFMIKPLFARAAGSGRTRSLDRQREPLLFAFVERICELVGASPPRRIDVDCDVNASASFRRGWLSMLLGGDMVLTIGMPLAAGLSLQQLAGVLAHEFGHFSQGAGMRLTYVVRSINFWFVRVVYERDAWDEWLASSTQDVDWRIALVLQAARLGVWLSRRVLWCLMMLGHLVAGFMLRQMEFDADGYETRLAGSETFESTARRLRVLGVAYQAAQSELVDFYQEGRLADNVPKLMVSHVQRLPGDLLEKLNSQIDEAKTGLLDSHPADRDRIAAARRLASPGVFHSDLPASVLFRDFADASRGVTHDLYCEKLNNPPPLDALHPVDDLIDRSNRGQQASEARNRFFMEQFQVLRPLPLTAGESDGNSGTPPSARETLAELKQARAAQAAAAAAYAVAFQKYDQLDTAVLQAQQCRPLLLAKVKPPADAFQRRYDSEADCRSAERQSQAEQSLLIDALAPFESAVARRLDAALRLLSVRAAADVIADVAAKRRECSAMLPIVLQYGRQASELLELRNHHGVLAALLGSLEGQESNERLIGEIRESLGRLHGRIAHVRSAYERLPYPFDHGKGEVTTSSFLLEMTPPADDLGEIYGAAGQLLGNLTSLYVRCIDRLSQIAEEVEKALRLEPLEGKPAPPSA